MNGQTALTLGGMLAGVMLGLALVMVWHVAAYRRMTASYGRPDSWRRSAAVMLLNRR